MRTDPANIAKLTTPLFKRELSRETVSFTPNFQTTLAEHVWQDSTQGRDPWVVTVKSQGLIKELEQIPMGEKVPQDLALRTIQEQGDDFSIRWYQGQLSKQEILAGLDDSKPVYPCLQLIRNGVVQYDVREEKVDGQLYVRHENGQYLGPTAENHCFFMLGREALFFPSEEHLKQGYSF